VIELRGTKNDDALVRLGFIAEIPKGTVLKECGGLCGAWFIDDSTRAAHCKARHHGRYMSFDEGEAADRREDELLDEIAPLHMDRTKASIMA
jgi:hypothetical protein